MAHAGPPDPQAQLAHLVFALLLLDPESRIAEANAAAENMLGASMRRLGGQPVLDWVKISDPRVLRRLKLSEEGLTARGLSIEVADEARHVNLTLSPVGGHPGWRVMTLSDIGQRDMGDVGEHARPSAPSVLAHEIKNPLSAIRGASQLLVRKVPEADVGLLTLIRDEVDRIARLVDRMQRLGSRTSDPLEPVNLHEVIRNALAVVQSAEEQGDLDEVEFREEFDPSLPAVLASRDALQQVLINLIGNARDAAAASGAGRVDIRTRFSSGLILNALHPGRSVRLPIEITVTDNGQGIDPALRDTIFEPFVTTKQGGQGLGLALVRKLVRDMEGRIAHSRDEREGLTHFRLHLAAAPRPEKTA
ncbi:ATP-binding protein [Erythrobacter sp. LQ02-29]|nr:ATP-binding protein [Erythrobacter sp. 3-20A1M]MCP9223261.1 ATP-binding protein [Erythrobacter sp. LQ02-29]QWC58493.1 PAS domain-containing protein [Erythrobacter sp. 3-20A1M]